MLQGIRRLGSVGEGELASLLPICIAHHLQVKIVINCLGKLRGATRSRRRRRISGRITIRRMRTSQTTKAKPKDEPYAKWAGPLNSIYICMYILCMRMYTYHTHIRIHMYGFVCVCRTCETVLFMVVRCGKLIMRLSHLLALCFAARVCK